MLMIWYFKLGDQPIPESGGPVALAGVLARSGSLLGLV